MVWDDVVYILTTDAVLFFTLYLLVFDAAVGKVKDNPAVQI